MLTLYLPFPHTLFIGFVNGMLVYGIKMEFLPMVSGWAGGKKFVQAVSQKP